jgi:predicted secreted protein
MAEQPLAKTQDITLPGGRKAKLSIRETALGKASCYGAGGRGTFGDVIVQGLTLTLTLDDGASTILQTDKRLPKSRRCVTEYGIAEAWLHEAADGAQTLAVLLETVDAHEFHAGPNRRFMAVTKRLLLPR